MKSIFFWIFVSLGILCNAQIEALATPFAVYKIPAKDCVGVQHVSGSRIFIPQAAFNVSDFKGVDSLDLYYREFLNPLDFFTNQLDLHYKDGFLESGGMFELFVKYDGELVPLQAGKEIRVEMIKENEIPVLDEFYYDETSQGWDRTTQFSDTELEGFDYSNPSATDTVIIFDPLSQETMWLISQTGLDQDLFQTMNIDNYGLYNYDIILEEDGAVPLIASFSFNNQIIKDNVFFYVVYKDLNTLIYYSPYDLANNFRILPDKEFKIFTVSKDGNLLSWEKPQDFDLQKVKNQNYTFSLSLKAEALNSKENLAAALKL
jgi:hypothetical protein